jgi:hypothetical protein
MFGTPALNCSFYSFDLVVVGAISPPKFTKADARIADTVVACFAEIFKEVDNVVIAVYDSSDRAESARQRKFNAWFTNAGIDYVEKVDFELTDEHYSLLSSVFLHIDLPDKEAILNRYQLVLEGGNIPLD